MTDTGELVETCADGTFSLTVGAPGIYSLKAVAEGKADVYPRFAPTMEWDTAAGHAIARAAGMEVYQAGKEEPLRYNKEDLYA